MVFFKRFRLAICAALSMLGAGTAAAQNLLVNGGFETPLVLGGTYDHRNGTELTGWTLFSTYKGTVQFSSALYDAVSEGVQAVQLEVPGDWISQSFATTIGQSYLASFDLAAYSRYGGPGLGYTPCPCTSILDVTVGPLTETLNGSSTSYATHTLLFAATSTITTLTFANFGRPGDPWGNYPQVDNVSVVAIPVPEPETYSLMLAGLGLLGAVARRREQNEASV